jgi:hypothetical protein
MYLKLYWLILRNLKMTTLKLDGEGLDQSLLQQEQAP